ncbi:MAG: amidohydrolase family protein [Candidatus Lokiarchaeota archaeon]|nr:amidohydrolase family protein [Candidatus Lokiarchaeota archaeon]
MEEETSLNKPVDTVITNGKLVLESGIVQGGIGIKNGTICIIATDNHLPQGDRVIDAKQKLVLPGLIDGHAHIHDRGMLDHEEFTPGSFAAAAGGVTTIIDMPLVSQMDTPTLLQEKIDDGSRLSITDFSFNVGMMNEFNYPVIPEMIARGAAAFKAFTCEPFYTNTGVLTRLLSEVSVNGGHITVHCEDQGVLDEFSKDMKNEWDAPVSHSLSRPNLAEQLAVRQVIGIAEQTGGHLHIAHISTREGVREIEKGKLSGVMVTTEVCPHHLVFHRDEMNRIGPRSKMNPPLRSKQDRAELWSALLRGMIDITVSDHAPSPIEKKELGKDDIRQAWSGVDGIQMILRVLLSEGVNKARISIQKLVQVASKNPAKIFGLYPKKGVLQVGSDADIVIVDQTKEEKITSDMMLSKCDWTIYEGLKMKGVPLMTLVRGLPVYEDGKILVKPGYGQYQPMGGRTIEEEA